MLLKLFRNEPLVFSQGSSSVKAKKLKEKKAKGIHIRGRLKILAVNACTILQYRSKLSISAG